MAGAVVLAALVRAPFWDVARRTAVDGDTGLVGLMARHLGEGTTLWGQPYGSPLDAWLAAPAILLLGPTRLAARLSYFALSLVLVPLAAALARRAHPEAGPAAAMLMACPPAYAVLLAALPPPLYSATLVLLGLSLLLALSAGDALTSGSRAGTRLLGWGLVSGLAVWTHLMSVVVVAPAAALLAWRGRRRPAAVALGAAAFLLASAPWWVRALGDPTAVSVVDVAHAGRSPLSHAAAVVPRLHEPVLALLGTRTPVTADEAERQVRAGAPLALVLVLLQAGAVVLALRRGARPAALLYAAVGLLTLLAFPFPVRSEPHTVRFLTPALLPLLALIAAGTAFLLGRRRAVMAAALIGALQLSGTARLLQAWRDAGPEGLVPDCTPAREELQRRGLTRAFASYNTAYCLTYESGERILAAQPWNERFFGHPLPFRDEVRRAVKVAWVLVPGADFDLPSPRTFESKLQGIGAAYERVRAGKATVYFDFAPPFRPFPAEGRVPGPAGDGDPLSAVRQPPAGAAVFAVTPAVAASAITVLAGPEGLPPGLAIEVSTDGRNFERVSRRRPGRSTEELWWVNGHPELAVDGPGLTAVFSPRKVSAIRLLPAGATAGWRVGELMLHPPADPPTPWKEASSPGDVRAFYRVLLAVPR